MSLQSHPDVVNTIFLGNRRNY